MSKIIYPSAYVALRVVFDGFDAQGSSEGVPIKAIQSFTKRATGTTDIQGVKPMRVSLLRNSYREADTFQVDIDAAALPIAPKQIKTGAVEVFIYGAQQLGDLPPEGAVPTMVGLIDGISSEWGDSGRVVTLDGRDYTSLFLDRQWDPRRRTPAGFRIDDVLDQLIEEVDKAGNLHLEVEGIEDADLPFVGGSGTRTNKKGKPVKEESSYWDVMYDLAAHHGFILFVEGLSVVLTTPQNLIDVRGKGFLQRSRFANQDRIYRMAWGRNLTRLEMKRNLGKERTPQIRVLCYDETTQRTLEGRFPAGAVKATEGIGTERDQYRVFEVHGVKSVPQLKRIAETAYNTLARSEHEVSFSTADITDLDGRDLIQVRSGEAMAVDFDPFNVDLLETLERGERVRYLRDMGYKAQVAEVIASNFDRLDALRAPLRVRSVQLDFDAVDDGSLELSFEVQDFINVGPA